MPTQRTGHPRFYALLYLPILLAGIFFLWIFLGRGMPQSSALPVRGELDLSGHDPAQTILIKGEWGYQPETLISNLDGPAREYVQIPHRFPRLPRYGLKLFGRSLFGGAPYGYATYSLRITGLDPELVYGVSILTQGSAYRLEVNGRQILAVGTVGRDAASHKPYFESLEGYFMPDTSGVAEFALEISNFSYNDGGMWNPILIGEAKAVVSQVARQDLLEVLLFASFFTIGVFYMGLFMVNRDFKPLLYFAIVCLLMSLRTLLTNQRQFLELAGRIPWEWEVRLEFLSGYLLLPMFILFFHYMDFVPRLEFMRVGAMILGIAITLVTLLGPAELYMNLLSGYQTLSVASLLYFGWCIIGGVRFGKQVAWPILLSFTGFVATVLYDFYARAMFSLMPLGTYFVLVSFSVVVLQTIFRIKSTHDTLQHTVRIDPLTGLNNRHHLDLKLQEGIAPAEGHRTFIFFMDLNRFKFYNDTMGHKTGDAILVEAARRIRRCFRESDTVCRYGGDEFVAIAEIDARSEGVSLLLKRIREHFLAPIQVEGEEVVIGVSVGVSEFHEGDNPEKSILAADEAMYREKAEQALTAT
jgi:diguanylate cyclase (GGDEF)-like protein